MKVQGTQNVMDVLLQVQAASIAKDGKSDTGFRELLDGALRETLEPGPVAGEKKTEAAPQESEKPQDAQQGEAPKAEAQAEPEAPEAPQTEEDPDPQAVAAAAAVMVPTVILPTVPLAVTEEAPEPQAVAAIPTELPQPVTETVQAPVAQPQQAQEQAVTSQQPSALPEEARSEILSAELVVEQPAPQAAEPLMKQPEPTAPGEAQSQSKFDSMVAKASRELKGKDPAAENEPAARQVRTAEEAPKAPVQKAEEEPSKPAEVKKAAPKAEEPKEAVLTEDEVRELPQKPEAKPVEAPRQELKASPAEQIRAQVIENLETEKMEFRMQLEPKELGKVDVRMILESGKLAVEIMAASPKAVAELQKQAEGLMMSMRMQGIEVETVQVVQESQSSSQHMDGAFNMQQQQQNGQEPGQGQSGRAAYRGEGESFAEAMDNTDDEPERLLDKAI